MAAILRTQQRDTVEALCWQYYGRTGNVTEAVLEANPGLADYGPILPQGIEVTMPDAQNTAPTQQVVNLWD
ncbi:tail protein X [Pseudomonas nitroreducens]|uniref:tail protein X n=1 Tax=Pseudomonas nitroreducens TaxID=46680 RepID=UPI0038088BD9